MRHDPGRSPHQFAYRARQGSGAGTLRLLTVPDFVVAHGLDDGPASKIFGRQLFEMTLEMAFDLAFGLGHEPQAGTVPEQCGKRADAERTRVPEGVQHAGSATQFLEPGFTPGEVIRFFARRIEHEFPDFRVARKQGLGVVQRLGGHLARMVYAHEGRGFAPVVGRKRGISLLGGILSGVLGSRGYGPPGGRGCEQGP